MPTLRKTYVVEWVGFRGWMFMEFVHLHNAHVAYERRARMRSLSKQRLRLVRIVDGVRDPTPLREWKNAA